MTSIPHRQKEGLAGPVRSIRTDVIQFTREAGRLVEKPWYHSTVFYNAAGYATEQTTHNANGTVARTTWHYDGAERLAETRGELDGIASGRTVYLYDAQGRLSYELTLRADGSEGRQTRRFYEADGSYTEEFTVDSDQEQPAAPIEGAESAASTHASFIRTRRDASDRPLEVRFYEAAGSLLYRFVYHYNAQGLLTDMEQRTGDAPLFDLPADMNLAGSPLEDFPALFSPDTALSTVRYRYDERGRRIEAATWIGAHCTDRRVFAYNERGEKTAERRYGRDGKLQADAAYAREYDGRGNWVRETVREGGELAGATLRTIEYHGAPISEPRP